MLSLDAATAPINYLTDSDNPPDGVEEITKAQIEEFLTWFGTVPTPRQPQRRGDAYVNQTFRAFQQWFKRLLDKEEITHSPLERMSPPKVDKKPVPVPHEDEIRAVQATCAGKMLVDPATTRSSGAYSTPAGDAPRSPSSASTTSTSRARCCTCSARRTARDLRQSATTPRWPSTATYGCAPATSTPTAPNSGLPTVAAARSPVTGPPGRPPDSAINEAVTHGPISFGSRRVGWRSSRPG